MGETHVFYFLCGCAVRAFSCVFRFVAFDLGLLDVVRTIKQASSVSGSERQIVIASLYRKRTNSIRHFAIKAYIGALRTYIFVLLQSSALRGPLILISRASRGSGMFRSF